MPERSGLIDRRGLQSLVGTVVRMAKTVSATNRQRTLLSVGMDVWIRAMAASRF
jgi:hypothetical protein